jgi:hypothetical protein
LTENCDLEQNAGIIMKANKFTHAMIVAVLALSACATKPPLPSAETNCEYRLRIFPTFEEPMELMIQHDPCGKTVLLEFSYVGKGGYSPRRNSRPKESIVAETAWDDFLEAFHRFDPWSIPEKQPYPPGCDGYSVTLEMKEGERRKAISRWCPHSEVSEARFVKAINEIIKMSPSKKVRSDWLVD